MSFCKKIFALVILTLGVSNCSEWQKVKLIFKTNEGSKPTINLAASQVESEVSKFGTFLWEGIQAEMLAGGQPAGLTELVVQGAKNELAEIDAGTYLEKLTLTAEKSGFTLSGGSPVQAAAVAVTSGALKGLKKYQMQSSSSPSSGQQTQTLQGNSTTKKFGLAQPWSEAEFMTHISKGLIRVLAQLKDNGMLLDTSNSNITQTILLIASTILEQSSNLGIVNEANVVALSSAVSSALTGSLSQTSMKDAAPEAIPRVSMALGGLKNLALPVSILSQAANGTIKAATQSIASNGLNDKSSAILIQVLNNSISASYASAANPADFAVITGGLAHTAFKSFVELNHASDSESIKAAAELIYGTSVSALGNIPNLSVNTISRVLAEVQKNAYNSITSSGLEAKSSAAIISSINAIILHLAHLVGLPATESLPIISNNLADQLNEAQHVNKLSVPTSSKSIKRTRSSKASVTRQIQASHVVPAATNGETTKANTTMTSTAVTNPITPTSKKTPPATQLMSAPTNTVSSSAVVERSVDPKIQEKYHTLCVKSVDTSAPSVESCGRFNECFNIGYDYTEVFDKYSQCKFYSTCVSAKTNYLNAAASENIASFCGL